MPRGGCCLICWGRERSAQFETEIRSERQMDGIAKAKERGVAFGRQRKLDPQQLEELKQHRASGTPIKILMRNYRLSKSSVYRYLAENQGQILA